MEQQAAPTPQVSMIDIGEDWRIVVKEFLTLGRVPSDLMEERKHIHKVAWYVVVGDQLYYRTTEEEAPLCLYVPREEGKSIATSIRRGANGAHQGGWNLTL